MIHSQDAFPSAGRIDTHLVNATRVCKQHLESYLRQTHMVSMVEKCRRYMMNEPLDGNLAFSVIQCRSNLPSHTNMATTPGSSQIAQISPECVVSWSFNECPSTVLSNSGSEDTLPYLGDCSFKGNTRDTRGILEIYESVECLHLLTCSE